MHPRSKSKWLNTHLKQIVKKKFCQQSVPLDGYEFIDCIFEQVTFEYEGMAPSRMTNCNLVAPCNLHTNNPILGQVMDMYDQISQVVGHSGKFELSDGSSTPVFSISQVADNRPN